MMDTEGSEATAAGKSLRLNLPLAVWGWGAAVAWGTAAAQGPWPHSLQEAAAVPCPALGEGGLILRQVRDRTEIKISLFSKYKFVVVQLVEMFHFSHFKT